MKKHDRIAAIFLLLVGLSAGVHSWANLNLGTMQLPGAGFMPFVASSILTLSAGAWLVGSLGKAADPQPFWEGKGWLKPLLAVLIMLLYAFGMPAAGYLLATLLFMLAWQFIIERERWLKATLIAVITTAAMWLLFTRLLGVPLPAGILAV